MSIREVSLENGKYAIRFDENTGALNIFRHGELWGCETGSKFILSILHRIEELQEKEKDLNDKLDTAIGLLDECTDIMSNTHSDDNETYTEATELVYKHYKQQREEKFNV